MTDPRAPSPHDLPTRIKPPPARITARQRVARLWLATLFGLTTHAPWFVRLMRTPVTHLVVLFSRKVKTNTAANARRILGPHVTRQQCREFAKSVVGSFYDFVYDVGRSVRVSRADLEQRIESIEGEHWYLDTRAKKNGLIVVTAHMGSFEAGMAALLKHETAGRIHVVFKQDDVGGFETLRSRLRNQLGVVEAPLDEGWTIWMRLRDALVANDVVLLQGDRCMPGQKGMAMPMLGGHVQLPTGPVKLAMATGSPIIPVYSIRTSSGRVRIVVDESIEVEPHGDVETPMRKIAASIERQVRANPDQWLLLEKAFIEDSDSPAARGFADPPA